jgi:hypothetical protein
MVREHRNESHFQRSGFERDDFPGALPQAIDELRRWRKGRETTAYSPTAVTLDQTATCTRNRFCYEENFP